MNNLKVFLSAILLGGVVLTPETGIAQKETYPQGYFALPVYPGRPNTLSGVLGDLRSNHFHAGIDVRTDRVEGLPITAAADGYVSRIGVHVAGYGKVMYVKHPNGMTTVYAHLKHFNEEIGKYVREEQYKAQSFTVDLKPEEGRFQVKKGQLIAISGNTGSSEGPHLHFEIRDSQDNCLNPLFFNFPEIKDRTPPRFVRVALDPLTVDSRVNGRFERQVFVPVPAKTGNIVSLRDTVKAVGLLGLELQAFDRMDGTGFNYGLNCIEVRVDGEEVFAFNMEKFPVDVARDYNYLINYKARVQDNERYYRCYNPEGNELNIYQTDEYGGKLRVSDSGVHQVEIKIFDSFQNWSALTFVLKGEPATSEVPVRAKEVHPQGLKYEVLGSILRVGGLANTATWFRNGEARAVKADYSSGNYHTFLWDLKAGFPDSLQVAEQTQCFFFTDKIPPRRKTESQSPLANIRFSEKSLFDTLYLRVSRVANTLQINEFTEPLRGSIEVLYKPELEDSVKGKTHIYRLIKGRDVFVGGEWTEDGIRFSTRELGTFRPLTDKEAPKVRVIESSPRLISARISDDLSGISAFRAKVNGEWVLMSYEYKNGLIWSEKKDDSVPFEGEVELEVTDRAGNVTVVTSEIKEPVKKQPAARAPQKRK